MAKERKCLICGETEEDKFYPKSKSKCKRCTSNQYHNNPNKKDIIERGSIWVKNNLIQYRFLSAKNRAKRKGLVFELTPEIIKEMYERQEGKCYISGVKMSLTNRDWRTVSIDRIDSNDGYPVSNTILVTRFINNAKSNLSLDEFVRLMIETQDHIAEKFGHFVKGSISEKKISTIFSGISDFLNRVHHRLEHMTYSLFRSP